MPIVVTCLVCKKTETVAPTRAKNYRTCSFVCRKPYLQMMYHGETHHSWLGGERSKQCELCGAWFSQNKTEAISTFAKRKFCSKPCADKGGIRHHGPANNKWRGGVAKRGANHRKWCDAVISRDGAKCQECGVGGVEMHAHHIKSWKEYPELRWDVLNGVTLCFSCHWHVHSAHNANAVNSGKPLTDNAEGNPEPSPNRNIREGVTTRGRAYRRIECSCEWCGTFISRRMSDVSGRSHIFCSKPCAGRYNAAHRIWRPQTTSWVGYGSNASTRPARETDDIVWTHGRP